MNNSGIVVTSVSDLTALIKSAVQQAFSEQTAQQPAADTSEFMTVQQTAALLGLAVPTLYGKVHRREIPYSKTGKKLSFRRSDIQTWIEANRRPTATESRRTTLKIAANAMNKRKGRG